MIKSYVFAVLLGVMALTSGCASFQNMETARFAEQPPIAVSAAKPAAFVETRFFMGEPDKAVVEWLHMKEKLHALTTSAIEESGLLSELSMNEEEKGNFSNRIRVDVYNHGDQGAAAVFGFISGLTLGVIPAAATDNYTVKVVLLDREGKELKSSTSKDSVTTWIGLIFIPMAGNTPEIAVTETIKNQIKLGFRDLVDGGTLIAAK